MNEPTNQKATPILAVAWERYSHHSVGQMPVESGEEAETVLTGKFGASTGA